MEDSISHVAWILQPTAGERSAKKPDLGGSPTQHFATTAVAAAADAAAPTPSDHTTAAAAPALDYEKTKEGQESVTVEKRPYEHAPEDRGGTLLFIEADADDDAEGNEGNDPPAPVPRATVHPDTASMATSKESEEQEEIKMSLLDYLGAYNNCSLKELQVLFHSVQARQRMVAHLKQSCRLRTAHLKPAERNLPLHCHDLSAQNANRTFACRGYLDLTVRQYYFAKHGLKLKHPYLPCLIEFGGGAHASYYPLEVVHVVLERPLLQPSSVLRHPEHETQELIEGGPAATCSQEPAAQSPPPRACACCCAASAATVASDAVHP